MKKIIFALLFVSGIAQAQVTGNVGVTSDYRFRGISQTQNSQALQGGIDYSHTSGVCTPVDTPILILIKFKMSRLHQLLTIKS